MPLTADRSGVSLLHPQRATRAWNHDNHQHAVPAGEACGHYLPQGSRLREQTNTGHHALLEGVCVDFLFFIYTFLQVHFIELSSAHDGSFQHLSHTHVIAVSSAAGQKVISLSTLFFCFFCVCPCSQTGGGDGLFREPHSHQRGENGILHLHEQEGEADRQGNLLQMTRVSILKWKCCVKSVLEMLKCQ